MIMTAVENGLKQAETFPLANCGPLHINDSRRDLFDAALARREGRQSDAGALSVATGAHTGRAAQDKYFVKNQTTKDTVWWDNAAALTPAQFALLKEDFIQHAEGRELFVQDLFGGADKSTRVKCRVICELAWHALFIQHLMIEPNADERAAFDLDLTIVDLPSFKADPLRHGTRSDTVIAFDIEQRLVLIGGTEYAGEMKKSVFSFLNYILPDQGIMPMHCSVNEDEAGKSAIFFGLSGTGKTTLSADPSRRLVGDDEHGWSRDGVFNFEGGCYAKAIRLSQDAEPEIYKAINQPFSILENVVLLEDGRADFNDDSLTENSRGAYPLEFIDGASLTGKTGQPTTIIMLTADAFGVLPPIARLNRGQALYHFLSGYTAKVAGTEQGVKEPTATFSPCYGAPFMPRHPSVYGRLLGDYIDANNVPCWLVNTGWTGGPYGEGQRISLKNTRLLLNAALTGALANSDMRVDPVFGFDVPLAVDGLDDPGVLTPRDCWGDPHAYDQMSAKLVGIFTENFKRFADFVSEEVRSAGPRLPG